MKTCLVLAIALASACSAPPTPPPAQSAPPPASTPQTAPPATTTAGAPPVASQPKPVPVLQPPSPPKAAATQTPNTIPASKADVVAREERTVTMKVGQTVGISAPAGAGVVWQVSYDEDRLTPLTPKDKMTQPGEAGWVWRAKGPGLAEISMTGRAPCASPPCETNPPKITYSVQIADRF